MDSRLRGNDGKWNQGFAWVAYVELRLHTTFFAINCIPSAAYCSSALAIQQREQSLLVNDFRAVSLGLLKFSGADFAAGH